MIHPVDTRRATRMRTLSSILVLLLFLSMGLAIFAPVTATAADVLSEFYFAEGYVGPGFDEYLCLGNPNGIDATVEATYYIATYMGDEVWTETYSIPATSRMTVTVKDVAGYEVEVSIKVTSATANIIAERPMYFVHAPDWTGGHDVVGATAPSTTWYFAEGTTREGFVERITVLNPNPAKAELTFHYMVTGEGEQNVTEFVEHDSRETFIVADHVGAEKDVSLFLESDLPVVAERPMYFNYLGLANNNWNGGTCAVGVTFPELQWYFAEGTTRPGFEEWLCVQNHNEFAITVEATYNFGLDQGPPLRKTYEIPPKWRTTISVNQEVGPNRDVSCILYSEDYFIAERPMYFNYRDMWNDGHDVFGSPLLGRKWAFAEGYTGQDFDEWLCIWNPYAGEECSMTITYYPQSGTPIVRYHTIPPETRYTIKANDDAGANLEISAVVQTSIPVVVERPMYFNYNGAWNGGHDVVGNLCPT